MSKSALSELFQRWVKRGRRVPSPSRFRARLRLEEVEQRLAPATLPAPTASNTRVIAAGFAPAAVADPNNPNTIVVISSNLANVGGQISNDGGQTWSGFTVDTAPSHFVGGVQLTVANSPSVTFSRTGQLYVAYTLTTAELPNPNAGQLLVRSFTVANAAVAPLNPSVVLYEWLGQDPVFNPTVAVDNNVDQYKDPETLATTAQDTMLGSTGGGKAVYVAWNTNARTPQANAGHVTPPAPQSFTPTAIFAAASRDQGLTFSTPVKVSSGGFVVPPPPPGQPPGGGVAPRILFTPGTLNPNATVTPGTLQFAWSLPAGGSTLDSSKPDNGTLSQQVVTTNSFFGAGITILEPTIDPNNGPDIPNNSNSNISVNLTSDPFFNTLTDLDVKLAIAHPHVNQLQIDLIPPGSTGVGAIRLIESRVDGTNTARPTPQFPFGLPDNGDTSGASGIGRINSINGGTTFDAEAARYIFDPANSAPYIAHFKPEGGAGGSISQLYGASAADLSGVWTLRIRDFRDDDRNAGNTPGVPQFLSSWSIKMSSLIQQEFGQDVSIPSSLMPTSANLGGSTGGNATALGFGAGLQLAYDTSLGAFSPFSGRLYQVYASPGFRDGQDIFLRSSDNSGQTWSSSVRVNDDSFSDNFTEGNRAQFMPSVAVDPVTGTVAVTWYDARNDASNARAATYIATSIDGGKTFSRQDLTGFLNTTKTAVDQLTRTTVQLEPVPTNLRAAGTSEAGIRQSLLAYGGQIKPFWTGNENAIGASIYTATVQTAAGPRIVDNNLALNGDQGAVTAVSPGGYNNTFSLDGTRQITGFTVTFDRPIQYFALPFVAAMFDSSDVTVLFRAPTTQRDASVPPTKIPVAAVVPLDPNLVVAGEATKYFVQFATPQSAVGTYSYSVGPDISDRIRSRRIALFTAPDGPKPIKDLSTTESTLSVPVQTGNPFVQQLEVKIDIAHTFDSDLRITLFGPDPDGPGPLNPISVVLANGVGGSGNNFTNTRFNDGAADSINAGAFPATPPFTGVFRPDQPLAAFVGTSVAGTWTLRVEDRVGGDFGTLNGWSISFLDATGNPVTFDQSRTFMDQDADSRTREIGTNFDPLVRAPVLFTDAFTAPKTIGGDKFNADPFALSFDPNTLPLIVPGPHLIATSMPANPTATDNLVLNGTASQIDATFDRDIDPASFTPANILRMTGPTGPVNEQQTITVLGTSGTFAVSFNAGGGLQTTGDLAFNVPASGGAGVADSLQNALAALSNIGVGNVNATSAPTPGGTVYTVKFIGKLASANQPQLSAVGTGAAASVATVRFTVTPLGTASAAGGYRSFRIGFPTQNISGPYNIEFGPNSLLTPSDPLYSLRSVNVGQLVALVTPASATPNTLTVAFDRNIAAGGFVVADVVRVTGPNGAVSLAGATVTPVAGNPRQFQIVFPAALPNGQYVVDFNPNKALFVANSGSAIDANFNAGLDVLRGTDPSASTFVSRVFSSTGTAVINPATDNGSGTLQPTATDLSITIADDFVIQSDAIQNIQLLMNIAHPNVRDLNIDLIPPSAAGVDPIRLFSGSLLAGTAPNKTANFTNTRLLDRVNDPNVPSIEAAQPPFNAGASGFFSPQQPLSALLGKSAKGVWTLRVTNNGTNPATTDPNFNPLNPIQIVNWSLTLPRSVPGTGLGESVADRFQASFRIFTQNPTNDLTRQVWTPVGPAPTNEGANSARITTIAVDPSDPTGNTVYVAAAGAGVWKTTDFLTGGTELQNGGQVPSGPHYVPLTDFGTTNAVNVSSLALFPRNGDPHQTIVFALTGEGNVLNKFAGQYGAAGVGVLRSMDGGKTWQVLDSTTNVDNSGAVVKMSDSIRDHVFVGGTGYKIVLDPTPGKDGGVIVYMAVSGTAAQGGLWRSLNGGNTWTRIQAGNATDVVLAAGSANTNDPLTGATVFEGNLQQLYAAFSSTPVATGFGVYKTDSAPAAASLDFLPGGANNPLIHDVSIPTGPQITTTLPASTPNVARRIALAVPALTGNALQDSFLKDWLYAATTDVNGAAQLYLTKDAGAHWTLVRVPTFAGFGTNNETSPNVAGGRAQVNVDTNGDYNLAVAVDPQNPYIVYLAGTGTNSIRLDLTKIRDAHNFTFYNNSDAIPAGNAADPAFTTQVNGNFATIGGLRPQILTIFGPPFTPGRGAVLKGGSNVNTYVDDKGVATGFLNLSGGRDFDQPFTTNSLIRVTGTGNFPQSILAGFFVNDGADISWSPFADLLDPGVPDQTGSLRTENRFSGANIHTIQSITDPVTHKTRLFYGTDDGIFTGVDSGATSGTGTVSAGIGFSKVANFNRNGNLQISQFYSGAVQPSQLAADLAGALFYGMGDKSGFPVSSSDILTTGSLNWRGPTGDGVAVLVDQSGSGTAYQYRSPSSFGFDRNATATNLDFFRVLSNTSDHAFGGGVGRTGNSTGSLFDNGDNWPNTTASGATLPGFGFPIPVPTVNPQNPNVLMIGSTGGRVYRSLDQGNSWILKAQPGDLDTSAVLTVAFGASDPTRPTLTNNFLYAGTNFGQIYSTTTGGAPWTLIGSNGNGLDGTKILRFVPNPQVGSKDVFALTTSGVFYKRDGTTAAGTWDNLTGNLFSLTRSVFGDESDQTLALKAAGLTSLVADWRYAIPDPADPTHTFPILYTAGNGGVFRSKNFGSTWTFFPDTRTDGAAVDGGYLPDTHITDLDLSIGNLDPASGRYKAGGLNMLVATTYGRGTFAIRLDNNLPANSFISGPRVTQLINPNPVNGPSDRLNVQFNTAVDPTSFSPADVQLIGPGGPVTITDVRLLSVPDPATGINPRNLYEIDFATQTGAGGSYDLTIGYNPTGGNVPLISDLSGFLMNQNANLINGEPTVDQYRNTILLNTPTNNHLVVTSFPSTATAGVPVPVRIEARDANDVLLSGVSGTLNFSPAVGTGTFTPPNATMSGGAATFFVTYQTAGPQTVIAAFAGGLAINGTSWTTTVSAAPVTQLIIAPAFSVVTAPATQTFTLLAEDRFGNTVLTYTNPVDLTSTGAAATLPSTIAVANGSATFTGTFNAAGTVQIAATGPDPANASVPLTGSATVSVNPGPADHLAISTPSGSVTVNAPVAFTVQALDAQGNFASNLDGLAVTLAVTPGGTTALNPTSPIFVNGATTFAATFTATGTYTITATRGTLSASTGIITVIPTPLPPSPTQKLTSLVAVGTGVNGSPAVDVHLASGAIKTSFVPFPGGFNHEVDPSSGGFTGGERTAVGDVTGDGVPDYIVGTGPTITASVRVFDGATGQIVLTYQPFDNFQGGVFVSVGDIDKDGIDEIAITPDEGGGPRVVILKGGTFARIGNFFGINDPNFRGGARTAIGDLNADGFAELVVSAGFGGGPRISIFDGAALAQGRLSHPIGDFFMFESTLRNGAYVAVGDVNGDGFADLIAGAGPGGGPRVLAISGKTMLEEGPERAIGRPLVNFFAGDFTNRGGIRVAAKNLDGDRNTDIVVGSGDTGGSSVTAYLGVKLLVGNTDPFYQFDALPGYTGGVFVG